MYFRFISKDVKAFQGVFLGYNSCTALVLFKITFEIKLNGTILQVGFLKLRNINECIRDTER